MSKQRVEKPVIRHMATLGSLGGYGDAKGEWSIERKLRQVKEAGFDGFLSRVTIVNAEQVTASGLIFACPTDLNGIPEIRRKLKAIKAAHARVVNVHMLDHDTLTPRAVGVARRLMDAAEDLGIDVSIEVHRDTRT